MSIWPSRRARCTALAARCRRSSAASRCAPGRRPVSPVCSCRAGPSAIRAWRTCRRLWELMDKNKTNEIYRRLAKILLIPDDMGRPFFGPPGMPADRLKMLRDGFNKMMSDPELIAEAKKKGLDAAPLTRRGTRSADQGSRRAVAGYHSTIEAADGKLDLWRYRAGIRRGDSVRKETEHRDRTRRRCAGNRCGVNIA